MFLDKVDITIKAGNGGNGHTSFLRDRQTMRGGPDGGDGGRGGNVVFVGSSRVDNLIDFRFVKKFFAENGVNGRPGNRTGANGKDLEIPVPLGTKIYKSNNSPFGKGCVTVGDGGFSAELLADITEVGQQYVALRGGAGGRGNTHFATSKRQTPNFSHGGVKTTDHAVRLELQSIADVGLVGFPNIGKSTLLSTVTRANPKIANYPFTTLHPNIGIYSRHDKTIILADIPGLIEGAHTGKGLGIEFLKHINRTRLLVHMVDDVNQYHIINNELASFSQDLIKKPKVIVINKIDALEPETIDAIKKEINQPVFEISCATRAGIDELMQHIADMVEKLPKPKPEDSFAILEMPVDKNAFEVDVDAHGVYHVVGPMIDNLIRGVVLSDTESARYFHKRLEQGGVIAELKKIGMQDGDMVQIADTQFEWRD